MLPRGGMQAVTAVNRALQVALDDDARASAVLEALRQLSIHAVTLGQRDTLVELQVAALRLLGTAARDTGREEGRQRFLEAWLAFNTIWAAQTKAAEHAT